MPERMDGSAGRRGVLVRKYGGSSLASIDRVRAVADDLVRKRAEGYDLVVVVSAMGRTTDDLLHLARQGRKRIAHFAAPQNLLISRERKQGYLDALALEGLPYDPSLYVEADTFEKAEQEVKRMIAAGNIPDALFGANDLTAIGAMKSFQAAGFRVPGDIAVAGFSDSRFAEVAQPTLTSVDQHGFDMGTQATQMLLRRIDTGEEKIPYETRIVKADLIIRNSSTIGS